MKRCTAADTSDPRASEARRATFIIRMWTESNGTNQLQWRGTVEHAQTGERRAVAGPDALVNLLLAWLSREAE